MRILVLLLISVIAIEAQANPLEFKSIMYFGLTPSLQYEFIDNSKQDEEDSGFEYTSNSATNYGVSLEFKHFSLGLSYPVFADPEAGDERINSTFFDFLVSGYNDRWMWEAHYQNYQGFNIQDEDNPSTAKAFEHIGSSGAGIRTQYYTNDDFDIAQSHSWFGLEKKSNWSWVHSAFLDKSTLHSSQGLVPRKYREDFEDLYGMTHGEFTSLGYGFGITGLYRGEKWFAHGEVILGAHAQQQHFEGIEQEDRTIDSSNISQSIGAGYLGKTFEVGVFGLERSVNTEVYDATLAKKRGLVQLYFKLYF